MDSQLREANTYSNRQGRALNDDDLAAEHGNAHEAEV